MTKFRVAIASWFILSVLDVFSQNSSFNSDGEKSFININMPKTPESQAFDRYGSYNVNELTGTADIKVPIYTLQSKFLSTNVALSYNATGIRVNQEASWAGLGFDLIAGGRITLDIKGNRDGVGQWTTANYKLGLQKIFDRLGTSYAKSILTFASTQVEWNDTMTIYDANSPYDDARTVESMAWWGVGEPDIYHASFEGQSFTFYIDLITDSIKFIGEKSLCHVTPLKEGGHTNIIQWQIRDSKGIDYYFTVAEGTKFSQPSNYGLFAVDTSTTAWLLTKIIHPTGDSILFIYNNYGPTYPALNWSASVGGRSGDASAGDNSNDAFQNDFKQYPAYLTKIETNNTSVDFVLSNRLDLRGPGAKKLDEIRITDKLSNVVKKKIQFRYGYFQGMTSSYTSSLPDSLKGYALKRLKLDSLYLSDSATGIPPYRFHYFSTDGPDKFSFSQDHWGYYNATNNTSATYQNTSPKNLIPKQSDLIAEKILAPSIVTGVTPPADGVAVSRKCDTFYMKVLSLDMITYPTGGQTVFTFEPHQSNYISPSYTITGGGLRVKQITNKNSDGSIALATEYTYSGGVYMGSINYLTNQVSIAGHTLQGSGPSDLQHIDMTCFGAINEHDFLIGYSQVKKTDKNDFKQTNNGSIIKYFNIPQSYEVAMSSSVEVRQAHYPIYGVLNGDTTWYNNDHGLLWLNPYFYGLAPTPRMQLDGKLTKEEYLNSAGQVIKSIDYYYSQKDYSQKLYSIRAKDNYVGGLALGGGEPYTMDYGYMRAGGVRRYVMVVSPAKSFFTTTDSIIEKTYQGSNFISQKRVFGYNQYFQPELETVYNSDGTQTIIKTLTSLAFGRMVPGGGIPGTSETLDLTYLLGSHILDLPIEQTKIKRTTAGDSLVVASTINIYKGLLPRKSYSLETQNPITYRSQFVPLYLSTPDVNHYTNIQMDSRYKLQDTAAYSQANLIKDASLKTGNRAYIWDEYYNQLLAQALNATNADIAYSSFESNNYGNWTITSGGVTADNTSPTGSKAYSLTSGNMSKTGLSATQSYIVSYWSKAGSQTVNSTSGTAGPSFNGWTYYEHIINNPAGGTITISGSALIDEVRLYPKGSLFNTYTYAPIIGLVNQTDVNNRIARFEYDLAGRLARIRDEKKNIVKQFSYAYNNVFNFPYGNDEIVSSATKSGCATGYVGHVTFPYTVPANKYGSFISKPDANSKAQADVNLNGQIWADLHGICIPDYTFTPYGSWNIPSASFGLGTNTVTFSIVIYGTYSSVYGQLGTLTGLLFVPSTTKYVSVTSGGKSYTLVFYNTGQVNIMGPSISGSVQFNGSYTMP